MNGTPTKPPDLDAIRARADNVEVEFVRSLRCLALELPESVYDDFAEKARAYMALRAALLAEIKRLREALREIQYLGTPRLCWERARAALAAQESAHFARPNGGLVTCDDCGIDAVSSTDSMADARRAAGESGWLVAVGVGHRLDYCPACRVAQESAE